MNKTNLCASVRRTLYAMSLTVSDLREFQVLNGRTDYKTNITSSLSGYKQIVIHPGKKHEFGHLSPYTLTLNDWEGVKDVNVENSWQFSKVYKSVKQQDQWNFVVGHQGKVNVWSHPHETFTKDYDTLTQNYWLWRRKGFANPRAVRYPNGYQCRHEVLYSLQLISSPTSRVRIWQELDYVEARRAIYNRTMIEAITCSTDPDVVREFEQLKSLYRRGERLIFSEVDGPAFVRDSHPYDRVIEGKLGDEGVDLLPTENSTIHACLENTDRSFGHGYVVACLVMGKKRWLV